MGTCIVVSIFVGFYEVVMMILVAGFLGPVMIIFFHVRSYVKCKAHLKRSETRQRNAGQVSNLSDLQKKKKKSLLMCMLLAVTFIVGYVPVIYMFVLFAIDRTVNWCTGVIAFYFLAFNSFVDPLIYLRFNEDVSVCKKKKDERSKAKGTSLNTSNSNITK